MLVTRKRYSQYQQNITAVISIPNPTHLSENDHFSDPKHIFLIILISSKYYSEKKKPYLSRYFKDNQEMTGSFLVYGQTQ